jgi:pyridinium-3,5-biscarboxylic acid mononucleotide synthase
MDPTALKKLLDDVASGATAPERALQALAMLPFTDHGFAKHDWHRPLRNGFAEVILCEGKRPEHLVSIVSHAIARGQNVFGTRADLALCEEVRRHCPEVECDPVSRTFRWIARPPRPLAGHLAIIAAGTADLPVAEEAFRTASFLGIEAHRHYDVGVAGLQRLLASLPEIRRADVAIVVAGMEGALPSVVGGLIAAPIIAVPTSIGYGANLKGIAALLGMLCSCSEGVAVVNIDNGFGAACAALRILQGRAARSDGEGTR